MNILTTINLALQAYIAWVKCKIDGELDTLEDEIYSCIDNGSPTAKLRLKRLEARRQRKLQSISPLRSTDDSVDRRPDLPV